MIDSRCASACPQWKGRQAAREDYSDRRRQLPICVSAYFRWRKRDHHGACQKKMLEYEQSSRRAETRRACGAGNKGRFEKEAADEA